MARGEPEAVLKGPHNIEAEQALLGCLMLNNDSLEHMNRLEPWHFFDPVHGRIFERARKMIMDPDMGHCSPVTMKPYMADDKGFHELGGTEYLIRLAEATIAIFVVKHYVSAIIDLAERRSLMDIADAITAGAMSSDEFETAAEVRAVAENSLAVLSAESPQGPPFTSIGTALAESMEQVNRRYQSDEPVLSTGIRELDELIGGLRDGNAYFIGGRPGMGKTGVALKLCKSVARAGTDEVMGRGVFFDSKEMPRTQLANRFLSMKMAESGQGVPYNKFESIDLTEDQFREALEHARTLEHLPLLISDDSSGTLAGLRSSIAAAQKQFERSGCKLSLVVVDYLQLIRVPGVNDRMTEVSEAARSMKSIAKQFDCPVVALTQLSRKVEEREDKRPMLSDLRQSGEIEEAGDVVIMLFRDAYYIAKALGAPGSDSYSENIARLDKAKHSLELIVSKNRHGPEGVARTNIDVKMNRIWDDTSKVSQADQEGFDI
ncbi:MAG: DnaB-like helicase C-terminal domain-containing protein [Pseudomonadota bacterium]